MLLAVIWFFVLGSFSAKLVGGAPLSRNGDLYDQVVQAVLNENAEDLSRLIAIGAPVNQFKSRSTPPLTLAVAKGNAEVVRLILNEKPLVDFFDKYGITPLMATSTIYGEKGVEIAQMLLDAGEDPNIQVPASPSTIPILADEPLLDNEDESSFVPDFGMYSVLDVIDTQLEGRLAVQPLEVYSADENDTDDNDFHFFYILPGEIGYTALHYAAKAGNVEVVNTLLANHKCDPMIRDYNGETALFKFSNVDITKSLLNAGLDPSAQNIFGSHPLFLSVMFDITKIAEALIEGGANVELVEERHGIKPTPLYAVQSLATLHILLKHQANIMAKTTDGNPAYFSLLKSDEPQVQYKIFKFLLENCQNIDLDYKSAEGNNLFSIFLETEGSLIHGNKALKLLIENDANVNIPVSDGKTPLMLATGVDNWEAAKLLLLAGATRDATDIDGMTALDHAGPLCKELLEDTELETFGDLDGFDIEYDPNRVNSRGETAIFVATKFDIDDLITQIDKLIKTVPGYQERLEVNKPNAKGVTPFEVSLNQHDAEEYGVWIAEHAFGKTVAVGEREEFKVIMGDKEIQAIVKAKGRSSTEPHWSLDYFFKNRGNRGPIVPLDYVSPNGDSLLLMAIKADNFLLVKFYLENIPVSPVLNNPTTGETVEDLKPSDKIRELLNTFAAHEERTLPILEEDHCPICLDKWEEEGSIETGQGIHFLCSTKGHVVHHACAKDVEECPFCKAKKKPAQRTRWSVNANEIIPAEEPA